MAHADRGKQPWRSDVNQADPSLGLFPALNFNTDEISCGIGMASLNRLAQTIRKRVDFVAGLIKLLKSESEICKPYNFHMGFSPFFFPIFVDVEKIKCTKIEFAQALVAEGIPNNVHYGCLISSWDYSRQYMMDKFATPNAENVRDRSFNLFLNENYGKKTKLMISSQQFVRLRAFINGSITLAKLLPLIGCRMSGNFLVWDTRPVHEVWFRCIEVENLTHY